MLISIFKAVLFMSCVGTVFSIGCFVLRPLTQRLLGHNWQYRIWIVVVLAMLVPVSVTVSHPQASPSLIQSDSVTVEISDSAPVAKQERYADTHCSKSFDADVSADTVSRTSSWYRAGAYIWIVGAMMLMVVKLLQYFLFLRTIRKNSVKVSEYKKINVLSSDFLSAPFTVGLLRKTIILPQNIPDSAEKTHILLHEYTHIKNGDLYCKWLCLIARCIHWFNPFVYILSGIIDKQCEIVCDLSVTKSMNDAEKKSYMRTILSMITAVSMRSSELTTGMASSKSNIESRFSAIVSHKRRKKIHSLISALCATVVVLAVIVGIGLMGGRFYDEDTPAISFSILSDKDKEIATVPNRHPGQLLSGSDKNLLSKPDVQTSEQSEESVVLNSDADTKREHDSYTSTYSVRNQYSVASESYTADSGERFGESPKQIYNESAVYESEVLSDVSSTFKEGNRESISEGYDVSYDVYPYSGRVEYEGLNMAALTGDIEKSGGTKLASEGSNLNNGYIPGRLTYEKGGISEHKSITSDDRGHITFYMDSDYDQHVNISFTSEGEQIAGYGIVPDSETTYVFGGFDPSKEYDITITSSTGSTWMVESDYVIY